MKTFLVVEATPNPENMEELQAYGAKSQPLLKKHGGVQVAGYDVEHVMNTEDKPAMIGVFSFPNREAIDNLLVNDPEYQEIIPLRNKGFKDIKLIICKEKENKY